MAIKFGNDLRPSIDQETAKEARLRKAEKKPYRSAYERMENEYKAAAPQKLTQLTPEQEDSVVQAFIEDAYKQAAEAIKTPEYSQFKTPEELIVSSIIENNENVGLDEYASWLKSVMKSSPKTIDPKLAREASHSYKYSPEQPDNYDYEEYLWENKVLPAIKAKFGK